MFHRLTGITVLVLALAIPAGPALARSDDPGVLISTVIGTPPELPPELLEDDDDAPAPSVAPPAAAIATGSSKGCRRYAGENYIRCVESAGNQGRYLADRAPHPGPSSASGPYGLLSGTRHDYHCAGVSDRTCATRYMLNRYGSWSAAAAAHRRKGWW